jgi:hypothetical protein
MTAWAKALNACQTADLLENRNSDRPSHSPAHIGPGADVGDRQRKLLSCIFRFTPGRLCLFRDLTERSEYRASVCLCVPLFSHFGGATANRQVPAPIIVDHHSQRGCCASAAPAAAASAAAHPVSCVPKRRSQAFPEEMGQTHIRQEDLCKSRAKDKRVRGNAKHERQAHSSQNPSTRLLSNALQPNHSNALRRGGVGCR